MGRDDEAITETNLGLELDPLNFFTQCFYVGQLLHLRQYDEAILQLRKILSSEPDFPQVAMHHWKVWF